MKIRGMTSADLPDVIRIWNGCVGAGEVLYFPMEEASFSRKFLEEQGCEKENLLVAEWNGWVCGFLQGVAPGSFSGARMDTGYLTVVMTEAAYRRRGIGRALVGAFGERMACRGAQRLEISGLNPVQLDWYIPGTPGHDHNHMPGVDMGSAGYPFLMKLGFSAGYRELALYRELSGWRMAPETAEIRERLRREGIETGIYDVGRSCGFDRMCDRVGSEYWRAVLRTETEAWRTGKPNGDPRMWADHRPPRGPRPLITAVREGQIVGFTGPVDLQKSGRGWFAGICTDPACERRGIATVLFSLLLEAFVQEGAGFVSLYTGEDNPGRKVYERAGLQPVRRFCRMSRALGE